MTPEEREKAEKVGRVFTTHLMTVRTTTRRPRVGSEHMTVLDHKRVCHACGEPWPCSAIVHARELTADLSEEVD